MRAALLLAAATVTAAAAAEATNIKPNLIFILADDLGHNDVGWANNRTLTPHLDELVKGGVELLQWYVFKYCAPTRGMLMTGRYPFHFGEYNNQDANNYGVPLNFTFLPEALKNGGNYRTHAIGKWHMGFRSPSLTPTHRGYDTYLGYYHMEEDYYNHTFSHTACGAQSTFLDFSNSTTERIEAAYGFKGVYSAYVFAAEAQRLMVRHKEVYSARPFFLYLPFQSVHGPYEAPESFVELYAKTITTEGRRVHQGMVTALDEAVGNVTATFKATGLYENSLIWFSSDNGGPVPAANNFPLRGGKFTNWEGGTRVRSFVHSPNLLPASSRGTAYDGIISGTDIFPTFCHVAGVTLPGRGNAPNDMDGMNVFDALKANGPSPRHEIFYAPIVNALNNGGTAPLNPEDCAQWGQSCGGALRVDDYKIVIGYPGDSRVVPLPAWDAADATEDALQALNNAHAGHLSQDGELAYGSAWSPLLGGGGGGPGLDGCNYTTGIGCPCHHLNGGPCLFDVVNDWTEANNLANSTAHASIFDKLLARFKEISATGVPMAGLPPLLKAKDEALQCAMLTQTGAFEPFGEDITWPYPTPPVVPVFNCGSSGCVESGAAGAGVHFSDAKTCSAPKVCTSCTDATVVRGKCVKEFQHAIANVTTAKTPGDCCAACAGNAACKQWNYDHHAAAGVGKVACVLKSVKSAANPGHDWCDCGPDVAL